MPEGAIKPALCGIDGASTMGIMEHRDSNALRRCREGHGLTQATLGQLLGFKDGSWISRWEHGEAVPNLESAIKLSILLDTPVDGLFANLAERLRQVVREQGMVVSLSGGVQGVPDDTEQPEAVPEGQGVKAEGCSEASCG